MINHQVKYSIYDTQLKKVVNICNKTSINDAIRELRKSLSKYDDISEVSDKDLFNKWGYILFKHFFQVAPNNKIDFIWLNRIDNIKIIYNSKLLNY